MASITSWTRAAPLTGSADRLRTRPRFEDLTETTGIPLSAEGAAMMFTRYAVGSRLATGKRVLELGCGAGQGFGLIGEAARFLVGGDYSAALICQGNAHYGGRHPFVRLSADSLPFKDGSFDLVLFFEASYYIPNIDVALHEVGRVTATAGKVLFVNANPERQDFVRSPHSLKYHTADEFRAALEALGFTVTIEGAFPVDPPSNGLAARLKNLVIARVRRLLQAAHLVPRTLRGRARLKRFVYGKLQEVPPELGAGFATEAPRTPVTLGPVPGFKVLYVMASRGA